MLLVCTAQHASLHCTCLWLMYSLLTALSVLLHCLLQSVLVFLAGVTPNGPWLTSQTTPCQQHLSSAPATVTAKGQYKHSCASPHKSTPPTRSFPAPQTTTGCSTHRPHPPNSPQPRPNPPTTATLSAPGTSQAKVALPGQFSPSESYPTAAAGAVASAAAALSAGSTTPAAAAAAA